MKTKTKPVLEQLEEAFLPIAMKRRFGYNLWLADKYMEVYVRRSVRTLELPMMNTLDIASIVVHEEYQRQGRCKAFLDKAHDLNPWDATFIENVHNPFLAAWLRSQPDWIELANHDTSSFYKLK